MSGSRQASSETTHHASGSRDSATGVPARLSASKGRAGGEAFIVLSDVHSFQVIVPFAEADAARMAQDQAAEVTFDAIPGLTRKATVAAVTPPEDGAKDAKNFMVKVVLTDLDPRLKDGLTAHAHVIFGGADNVLVVPTAAVHGGGQSSTVSVLQPDGAERDVPVELGMAGATTTEVVTGLREGDRVVVPEAG